MTAETRYPGSRSESAKSSSQPAHLAHPVFTLRFAAGMRALQTGSRVFRRGPPVMRGTLPLPFGARIRRRKLTQAFVDRFDQPVCFGFAVDRQYEGTVAVHNLDAAGNSPSIVFFHRMGSCRRASWTSFREIRLTRRKNSVQTVLHVL